MTPPEALYAWVGDTGTGEGIVAFLDLRTAQWWPMVVIDRDRALRMQPHAERLARVMGKPVSLVRYVRADGAPLVTLEPPERG